MEMLAIMKERRGGHLAKIYERKEAYRG